MIGVFKGKQGSDGDINDVGTDKDDGGMDKAEIQRSLEFLRVDGGDEGDVCAEIRVNLEGEKRREEDNPMILSEYRIVSGKEELVPKETTPVREMEKEKISYVEIDNFRSDSGSVPVWVFESMLKCPGLPSTTPSNSLSSGTSGDPTSSSPSFSSPEATGSPLISEPPASPSVSSSEPSSFSSSSPHAHLEVPAHLRLLPLLFRW